MKLQVKKRISGKKSEIGRLRREGQIPAVVYGASGESRPLSIERTQFESSLRSIEKGRLATQAFEFEGEMKGRVLVRDIQYHPVTYEVLHLDFIELQKDKPVTVNVPIRFTGAAESPGIKLGGFLRQVIRALKVSCLPNEIPKDVELNVSSLGMRQSLRLRDIKLPAGVHAKGKMDEVAVVIAKK